MFRPENKKTVKTLLVDGNNLLKIGFHGVKEYYHKGEHIGGLYHFINTLRKFIEEQNFDKVIVFWDGHENSLERRKIYPNYKLNRKQVESNELKEISLLQQREKIKKYLEELFVRQVEVVNNEADDLISYYCQISTDEEKIIYSADNDLTQLISDKVSIYSPNIKGYYKNGDKIKINESMFPHYNIKTVKILIGDSSDNIDGIFYLGDKTLLKFFPELSDTQLEYSEILQKAEILLEKDKSVSLKNLLTGKTKTGIYGDEFFEVNKKIIDLSNPLITDEGKIAVEEAYRETLDPENRGYQNLMRMMMNDGFFKYLPKADNSWVYFLKPFMKLTRKEKLKFKTEK